jgi:hypothetical protein
LIDHGLTPSEESLHDKMDLMQKAVPILKKHINSYTAHKVRAKAQFAKIDKIYQLFTESRTGLRFDHKQKVLPMHHKEGQIEYFGKRGMSLLGRMLMR